MRVTRILSLLLAAALVASVAVEAQAQGRKRTSTKTTKTTATKKTTVEEKGVAGGLFEVTIVDLKGRKKVEDTWAFQEEGELESWELGGFGSYSEDTKKCSLSGTLDFFFDPFNEFNNNVTFTTLTFKGVVSKKGKAFAATGLLSKDGNVRRVAIVGCRVGEVLEPEGDPFFPID